MEIPLNLSPAYGSSPVAPLDELEAVVRPDLQQVVVTPLLLDVHYQDLVSDCSEKDSLVLFNKMGRDISSRVRYLHFLSTS